MDSNDTLLDNETIIAYVGEYTIIPNLREVVQEAQDAYPDVQPLGLRPINIERTIDELAALGITTIGQLDKRLNERKNEITSSFNNYDRGGIAARHVFTPIYLLLELGG